MRNPYYQVLRTYWNWGKPTRCLGEAAVLVITLIQLAALVVPSKLLAGTAIGVFVFGFVLAGTLLWAHFREQVVSEQRQIYPGFARPHVTLFAIASLLLVIGWPLLMIARGAPRSMGGMGLTSISMALIGWLVLTLSLPLLFACVVGGLLTLDRWQPSIGPLLNGGNEPLAATLLLVGMVASALAIACMIRLTEEDPVFHRRLQLSEWNLRPRMTGDVNRAWIQKRRVASMFVPGGLIMPATTGSSLWSRARRWRVLTRPRRWWMLFTGVMMIASISCFGMGLFWISLFYVPAIGALARWQGMWRYLETDSLRPIARSAFISEIGLAIFLDLLRGWACVVLVIAASAYLWGDHSVWTILAWTWLAFLLQLPAFGIGVWIMRYRSPDKLILGSLPFVLLGMPVIGAPLDLKNSYAMVHVTVFVIATVILPIIGLIVVRDAHRRWLVTELG